MKKILLLVLILLLMAGIVRAQDDEDEDTIATLEYVVLEEPVNVRGGAGTGFPVVGQLHRDDRIVVAANDDGSDGWYQILNFEDAEEAYIAQFLVERAALTWYDPEQEPIIVFEGEGNGLTDIMEIPFGLYRIDAFVEDATFALSQTVLSGDCEDFFIIGTLFDEFSSRNRSPSIVYPATSDCEVIFEVGEIRGPWRFEMRDMLEGPTIDLADGSLLFGRGKTATALTTLPEGIWQLNISVADNAFIMGALVVGSDCEGGSIANELDFSVTSLEFQTIYQAEDDCTIVWDTGNVQGNWEVEFVRFD